MKTVFCGFFFMFHKYKFSLVLQYFVKNILFNRHKYFFRSSIPNFEKKKTFLIKVPLFRAGSLGVSLRITFYVAAISSSSKSFDSLQISKPTPCQPPNPRIVAYPPVKSSRGQIAIDSMNSASAEGIACRALFNCESLNQC